MTKRKFVAVAVVLTGLGGLARAVNYTTYVINGAMCSGTTAADSSTLTHLHGARNEGSSGISITCPVPLAAPNVGTGGGAQPTFDTSNMRVDYLKENTADLFCYWEEEALDGSYTDSSLKFACATSQGCGSSSSYTGTGFLFWGTGFSTTSITPTSLHVYCEIPAEVTIPTTEYSAVIDYGVSTF